MLGRNLDGKEIARDIKETCYLVEDPCAAGRKMKGGLTLSVGETMRRS